MIVKQGKKWKVKDSKGQQTFGTHDTKREALKQLRAIEYQKGTKAMDGGVKSPKRAVLERLRGYKDGGTKKDRMACNKPKRDTSGSPKTHVVKGCQDGKEKIVRFGHKMPDGTKNPKRRKSYCARSKGIGGTKNKLKSNYWSRRAWRCRD